MRKHRSFGRALPILLAILLLISSCNSSPAQGDGGSASDTVQSTETSSIPATDAGNLESSTDSEGELPLQAELTKQLSKAFATPVKKDATFSGSEVITLGRNVGGLKKEPCKKLTGFKKFIMTFFSLGGPKEVSYT